MKIKPRHINWNNVDWKLNNKELAEALGIEAHSVGYYRKNMHTRKKARATHRICWTDVNWNRTNTAIALDKLVTPSAVAAARRQFAPADLKHSPSVNKKPAPANAVMTPPEACEPERVTIRPAQPGFVKRILIKLRDSLFNLCISVEKEATK